MASEVAYLLRGKHKPYYVPYLDVGDHVIIINAGHFRTTGRKMERKTYFRHSGYPGGAKYTSLAERMKKDPAEVVRAAVRGMLPKGRLGRQMLRKLKVYAGGEHPHEAQMPKPYKLGERMMVSEEKEA
jgi:large subunit ribosomal protein L13